MNAPTAFDPSRARGRYRIATDDYLELILIPRLLERIWQEAPGIDIQILIRAAVPATILPKGGST